MISKIKNIQGAGDYENSYGHFYKFEYEFEDGTVITASHKTKETPFNVGDEANYEVKGSNDYGSWGKVSKPDQNFGGPASEARHAKAHKEVRNAKTDMKIIRQSCIKAASEFYAQSLASVEDVIKAAKKFEAYVNSEDTGTENSTPKDDLPF